MGPEARRGPEERVALGHVRAVTARCAQRSARGRRRLNPAPIEPLAERRLADRLAVDLRDDQFADPAILERAAERADGSFSDLGFVGRRQGLERPAAALEVQHRNAVDEDDVGSGRPLERPPIVLAATRPRDRGAVRVGRIRGSEEVDVRSAAERAGSRSARRRSMAPARANWAAPSPSTK